MLVAECRKAIENVEAKITEEVHKGTSRDKRKIRTLQVEHSGLTAQFAKLTESDRETPVDKTDKSQDTKIEADIPAIVVNGQLEAYCQKCKTKTPMVGAVISKTKGGKNGAKGKCGVCNSKTFRLVKN